MYELFEGYSFESWLLFALGGKFEFISFRDQFFINTDDIFYSVGINGRISESLVLEFKCELLSFLSKLNLAYLKAYLTLFSVCSTILKIAFESTCYSIVVRSISSSLKKSSPALILISSSSLSLESDSISSLCISLNAYLSSMMTLSMWSRIWLMPRCTALVMFL